MKSVQPEYPRADRVARHQGIGLFHVTIDLKTGSVVQVTMKKATGYSTLDAAAIHALKQWRWKPGTWRALDVPLRFQMAATHADYVNRVHQLEEQLRH
jgi:TonB family protein